MKIAEVVSTFPPYKGGIGNTAYYNARELAELGHEVVVFTPKQKEKLETKEKFKIQYIDQWFTIGNASFCPSLIWQIRNFDVIHLHYPFFGGAEFICLNRMITGQKLVITYQMDVVSDGLKGKFFDWHSKHIMPWVIKKTDKVLVTSFDYAEYSNIGSLIKAQPDKFAEMPNGVDIESFKPRAKSSELLKRCGIKKSDKVILFVGGLDSAHYFKGVDNLIRSLKVLTDFSDTEVPKFKLIIVGEGDLKPKYQALAKELDLQEKVIFAGGVGQEDLPPYYNLADVVVLPSIDKSEAFGIVLIEGMASAKPAIATSLAGVRTVVDDNKTGYLVKPGDIVGLGKKLTNLLSNPAQAKKFGERARKKAEKMYDWKKIGKKLGMVLYSLT